MQDYITELTKLQRSFNEAINQKDPDLSPEGQDKAAARTRDAFKAKLANLTTDFTKEASVAQEDATQAIPAAPGDTRQDWERAKMLLDAGAPLHNVVATADPAMLHALTVWGPTYLQAEKLKGSNDKWAPAESDPSVLMRSIRQRWADVLEGSAPERIRYGFEAEATAAEFTISAEHFGRKLDGVRSGSTDLDAAIGAKLAGQQARAVLTPAVETRA